MAIILLFFLIGFRIDYFFDRSNFVRSVEFLFKSVRNLLNTNQQSILVIKRKTSTILRSLRFKLTRKLEASTCVPRAGIEPALQWNWILNL